MPRSYGSTPDESLTEHGGDVRPEDQLDGLSTGTTIVALATPEGVVVGADQRASVGGGRFVAGTDMEKIEQVHPTGAVAIAGAVSHGQSFVTQLRGQVDRYRLDRRTAPSGTALARMAGWTLRRAPRRLHPLLGVVDDEGAHVFELDGAGGVIPSTVAAQGSGMQLAYSVLDDRHDPDGSLEEARETARRAIAAATERDTASGDGVTLATITGEGVDLTSTDDVSLATARGAAGETGGDAR